MPNKTRILFIHNKCLWYRTPLFNKLAERYDIKFLFTNEKKVVELKAKYRIIKRWGIYPFSIAFGLIPRLIKENYDIVIFPPSDSPGELIDNIFCFIITKLKRKYYIVWSEAWCSIIPLHFYKIIYHTFSKPFIKFIFRNADGCISPGNKAMEHFISLGVPMNKIFIMPNASEIEVKHKDLEKSKKQKRINLKNKKVILYVGRLVKIKGIEHLIKAFAKLRRKRDDVVLVIVGDEYFGRGRDYCGDELKSLCKDLRIQEDVYFVGEVKHDDLAPYYNMCKVFVLPSISLEGREAWGFVLNEAMSFGKPVIATDAVGGAYDLIKDGVNGFMVPEKNVDALYEAIKRIIESPELEKKMGLKSKKIIKEGFTYEHMVEGFKKAVDYALK